MEFITRTIAPLIYQPELVEGTGDEFGLGDINFTDYNCRSTLLFDDIGFNYLHFFH
jgi:hypothetical protein